jgi:hypothetical protein
MQEAIVKVTA